MKQVEAPYDLPSQAASSCSESGGGAVEDEELEGYLLDHEDPS